MPILHWLNDEEARKTSSRVPYRLLEADTTLSYGDPNTENMLIQGDNLEALKALLPYYAGQVKCIYIDPPYSRYLVVEYKGFDRWSDDDSKEKRNIGNVWEEKSNGQCLFIMPKGPEWNAILAKLGSG